MMLVPHRRLQLAWVSALLWMGAALPGCGGTDSVEPQPSGGVGGSSGQTHGTSNSGAGASAQGTTTAAGGLANTGGTASGAAGGSSSRARCKRGVAYGHFDDADLRALSKSVVFWYNWAYVPEASLTSTLPASLGVEYVPMVWGPGVDLTDVDAKLPATATTLLGYNEPNFYSQANVPASEAAARWPAIEALADKHSLRLVSPAVNFCGGGCHDTDPFSYLKAFFQSCAGCRVDAIAVHVYVGCQNMTGNHAQWLIDHLERYQKEFTEPLWVTEFACDNARDYAEQQAFLEDAVAYLEATPRIERYAWFAGRADNVPFVDLLGESGKLTPLGQAYVNAPTQAPCQP